LVDSTVDEGRVEIELTSNEPARRRRRATQRSVPPEVAAPATPPTQPPLVVPARTEPAARPPGRNRLIGIAAGAGVAGLLVGWLAGRDGGTLENAATVTTVVVAGSAPPPSFGDDASLVELDAPVLTTAADRQPLASTTSPAVESHLLALDSRLLGLPYEIVTAGAGGDIQYIDLARGIVTIVDGAAGADTGLLFVGDTWVLVPSGSTGDALLYEDGGAVAPRRIETVEPWGMLSIPGSPTLWMPDDDLRMNRPGQIIEVGPDLEPTGVRVDVPASPVTIEPPGNFIVPAAGGVYVVSGDGISRLTTGRLIALGPTAGLAEECDEQLMCKYVVIARATGERRDLPGLVRGAPLESVGWWAQHSETVSPDGRLAMVLLPTSERDPYGGYTVTPRLAVVDLVTGQTTPLSDEESGIQSVVRWTDDSQFAFFMTDGEVFAYVAATGELLRAAPDAVSTNRAQAFDLRPSAVTPLPQRSQLDDGPGDPVAEPTSIP
jgi:hypothetical protein